MCKVRMMTLGTLSPTSTEIQGNEKPKKNRTNAKEEIRLDFNRSWNRLVGEISITDSKFGKIRDGLDWLKEVMEKNVPIGKQNRAIAGIYFYRHLVPKRTEEEDFTSYVMGWCGEIMQAAALIADDMMDGSEMRRGKRCWYLEENVGYSAINDTLMLENTVYMLLKKYLSGKDCYVRLVEHFHETAFQTILGQSIDTKLSLLSSLERFSIEKYEVMVQYKTSYYSFYSPIASAMILAGLADETLFEAVEKVAVQMGNLFQVQDDYLDCFGDPLKTGKIGTDIADGKCTWFIVKALELGNENQRKVLQKCYGKASKEADLLVKQIYKELKLSKLYFTYEQKEYNRIVSEIRKLPSEIPREPLLSFADFIYQREK